MEAFGFVVVCKCLETLRKKAKEHDGLDYLQVFHIGPKNDVLWFIEDSEAVTALLPDDY